jgi:hypothetical protein
LLYCIDETRYSSGRLKEEDREKEWRAEEL